MTPLIQLWERAQEVEDELAVIRKMMKAPIRESTFNLVR